MGYVKTLILRDSLKYHAILGWFACFALMLYVLSALTHPIMVWTGPKAASFFPPRIEVKPEQLTAIPVILQRHHIDKALVVKIVPSQDGAILQITQDNIAPRRYFDLATGDEQMGYDEKQAIWLARFYSGDQTSDIRQISYQTKFDFAYPWVNRLLPVYKIDFERDDDLSMFIYTELSAMGNISNRWKQTLQTVFMLFHSWDWLENVELLRVSWVSVLVISILMMTLSGVFMIFMMKKRKKVDYSRRWHRKLAVLVWAPLLSLLISGFYHLWHYSAYETQRGLELPTHLALDVQALQDSAWLSQFEDAQFNAINLMKGEDDTLLYRFSLPNNQQHEARPHHGKADSVAPVKISSVARFKGVPLEQSAIYIDAQTGALSKLSDRDIALWQAEKLHGFKRDQLVSMQLITSFGALYDFRNKRLPVWQLDYDNAAQDTIFVDPATGMLVDRMTRFERWEAYSFSVLHKWSGVGVLIGSMARDGVVVLFLFATFGLTLCGLMQLIKRQKRMAL